MESDPFAEFLEFPLVDDNEDDEDDEDDEKSWDSVLPRDLNSAPLQGQVNAWNVRTNTDKMHVKIQKLGQIGTNWNAKTNGDKMQVKMQKAVR